MTKIQIQKIWEPDNFKMGYAIQKVHLEEAKAYFLRGRHLLNPSSIIPQ